MYTTSGTWSIPNLKEIYIPLKSFVEPAPGHDPPRTLSARVGRRPRDRIQRAKCSDPVGASFADFSGPWEGSAAGEDGTWSVPDPSGGDESPAGKSAGTSGALRSM